jgi:flagellar basal body rod protein FlgB
VNLELETTEMTKDNLMVQALVNGYNYKVGMLRSAISGGR